MRTRTLAKCTTELAKTVTERGIRIGARGLRDYRNFDVKFGKTDGFCEVVCEPGTRVYSQVSGSIGEPNDSSPGEGVFLISVWVSPSATGEMSAGASKPALIARALEKLFKENKALDLEALCIQFGEKAWVIRADVHIVDMNGCLAEAAAFALLGSLLTFRRPQAFIDNDTEELVVLPMSESVPQPLHLFHLPAITSFSVCNKDSLIAEPSLQEEEIFNGKLTAGFNESKELCYLHISTSVAENLLFNAMEEAEQICIERLKWMKKLVHSRNNGEDLSISQPQTSSQGKVINLASANIDKLVSEAIDAFN